MPLKWKRPESVPYPSIWRRFEGKREIKGKIPKFWIQDIPEEMFEEAAEAMCQNFIYDEPLCKCAGVAACPDSVSEVKQTYRELLKHKMALICFMENPENPNGKPIIAGLNITYISEKGEKLPEYHKKWLKVINACKYIYDLKDPFLTLGIDMYLSALGLSVFPEFRGQNIGLELLLARTDLCKATGVPATLTVFTATASQKLADKAGFKDLVSLSYDEIKDKDPTLNFPGVNELCKTMRFMYKMIE